MTMPRPAVALFAAVLAVILATPRGRAAALQGTAQTAATQAATTPIGGTIAPAKADAPRLGLAGEGDDEPATPRPLYNRAKEAAAPGQADHELHDFELRPGPVLRSRQAFRLHLVRDAAQHDVVRRRPPHAAGVSQASAPRRWSGCRMHSSRAFRRPPTSARSASSCPRWTTRSRRGIRRGSRGIRRSGGAAPAAGRGASCGAGRS